LASCLPRGRASGTSSELYFNGADPRSCVGIGISDLGTGVDRYLLLTAFPEEEEEHQDVSPIFYIFELEQNY
jgi:hypothetical protein